MTQCGITLLDRAREHGLHTAILSSGREYSYRDLWTASEHVASGLIAQKRDLHGERVAFLTERGFQYAAAQWGIWRVGGVAVPLCDIHPPEEILYILRDSKAMAVIAQSPFLEHLRPFLFDIGVPLLDIDHLLDTSPSLLPHISSEQRAMILYTSGTTGKPKGVVLSHANIEAQIRSLVIAWGWSSKDFIVNILPLHHVHGIVNVLACAQWAGARCLMMPRFEPQSLWEAFLKQDLTLFMAVPTVYVKLLTAWDSFDPQNRSACAEACKRLRLMVSGSAALPVSLFERWRSVTGHTLLERYGMTEIGMALSNPLRGERRPGTVGIPLPGVEVRLVDEMGNPVGEGKPGEIHVRGPGVFLEYWERPEETAKAFLDGWFRTGDVAVLEKGFHRILGRQSTDIIKTGGYKVSALEIEEVLRVHPAIKECAVVGVPDPEWGERVCAAVVAKGGEVVSGPALRAWAKTRLASYKVPSRFLVLKNLPLNPMGKVTKPALRNLFTGSSVLDQASLTT
jgi:malonyl-CoA/methylmalonyl-CoA synthetase